MAMVPDGISSATAFSSSPLSLQPKIDDEKDKATSEGRIVRQLRSRTEKLRLEERQIAEEKKEVGEGGGAGGGDGPKAGETSSQSSDGGDIAVHPLLDLRDRIKDYTAEFADYPEVLVAPIKRHSMTPTSSPAPSMETIIDESPEAVVHGSPKVVTDESVCCDDEMISYDGSERVCYNCGAIIGASNIVAEVPISTPETDTITTHEPTEPDTVAAHQPTKPFGNWSLDEDAQLVAARKLEWSFTKCSKLLGRDTIDCRQHFRFLREKIRKRKYVGDDDGEWEELRANRWRDIRKAMFRDSQIATYF